MRKYLTKAHELDPDNLTITLQFSNFLLHQHDDQENVDLLSPLVDEDEVDPQINWNLARSYQRLEQFDQAGKYFQAAAPTYQDNQLFLKELIGFYQETGQREQLLAALHSYLTLEPADTEMQELLDEYEEF